MLVKPKKKFWMPNQAPFYAAAGAVTTTWNSSYLSGGATLSNGNLTATCTTAGGYPGTGSIASHSTGKFYMELHVDVMASTSFLGICNSSEVVGNPGGVYDANGAAWRLNDGLVVYQAFTTLGNVAAAVAGNNISMAVDLGATLIWFRVGSGNWNNSGTANPATGAGGLNFSGGGFVGPFFVKWNSGGTLNDAGTANFGGSAYAQSVPSGFGNW